MEENNKNLLESRPKKEVIRNRKVTIRFNDEEREKLDKIVSELELTLSDYFRELGLTGKVIIKKFPKEILSFTGTLNHMAANLNQLAKKRNTLNELNALERAKLNSLSIDIKQLAEKIKNIIYGWENNDR